MNDATASRKYQRFASSGCQHANASRPPGRSCAPMFPNAAAGSSKNITPNWLIAASNGAPGNGSV